MSFARTLTPHERAERVLGLFGASWNAHVRSAMVAAIEREIEEAVEGSMDRELSVKQVAETLGKSVQSVRDMLDAEHIPSIRRSTMSGKKVSVSVNARDLQEYMETGRTATTSATTTTETPQEILKRVRSGEA